MQSAIVELQQRKHYLSELEANGLLKKAAKKGLLTPKKKGSGISHTHPELTQP